MANYRAQGETFVWADGTIYDPSIPGYRQATADELARNVPGLDDRERVARLEAQLAGAVSLQGVIERIRAGDYDDDIPTLFRVVHRRWIDVDNQRRR